jgi:small conductance mechanosensitive channel
MLPALPNWLVRDPEQFGAVLGRLALTVLVAWLVQRLGFLLVWRLERWMTRAARDRGPARQRVRTLGQTTRHLITSAVAAGALVHALEVLGWDVKPLLVGASILGAAIGFGAQSLVRDVIAGAFILIEDQFSVGDVVEANGSAATVEDVTLRSTRLRDYQGRLLFVPNGEMRVVINHSRDWHRTIVDVPVAATQDLARALTALRDAAAELGRDASMQPLLLDPVEVVGIERFGPEGAVLRVVARTRPGAASAQVARELRRLASRHLLAAGIRPAGPEIVLASAPAAPPGAPSA